MDKELRILMLEDVPTDADLTARELRKAGLAFTMRRVHTEEAFVRSLDDFAPDVILSDYSLPQFDGHAALRIALAKCPDVPFIFVSGTLGEEAAIDSLRLGATDYVLKNRLSRLPSSVTRALREVEERRERQRAEEALRLSDQVLRRVSSLVLVADAQGSIVYVSPSVKTILGYEPSELLGDRWWNLTREDPLERERERDYLARAARGEISIPETPYERLVLSRDRQPHWILWHDSRGPGDQLIGVGHDITERKQRERQLEAIVAVATALRAAATRAEMLPVIVNQVLSLLKADGAALVMRSQADEDMIVALARGAWADWTGMRIVPGEGLGGHILAQASSRPYLNNDIQPDPRLAWPGPVDALRAVAFVPLIAEKQTVGVLGIGRQTHIADSELRLLAAVSDMAANALHRAELLETLERRVEERTAEIRREQERTITILNSVADGVLVTDLAGTIVLANPVAEAWLREDEPDERQSELRRWLSQVTPDSGTVKIHIGSRALQVTVAYLREDDRSVGHVAVLHDITRLEELDRLKSKFVADVSHELRTPLANVKLYLALLDHGRPDKRDVYMETLQRETARLESLIENLLDLSRIDTGSVTIRTVPTDLNQLIAQLVADRSALAADRGLSLDGQVDPNLPPALADPVMLTQVMSNLTTNAINYTPRDGAITLVTAVEPGDARETDDAATGWITFTVRDTGPGISDKDRTHMFERFYRGEVGRSSGAPGTGLGLAICKEIVDRMGGRITVDSQPGQGAAFTVWLRPADPLTDS